MTTEDELWKEKFQENEGSSRDGYTPAGENGNYRKDYRYNATGGGRTPRPRISRSAAFSASADGHAPLHTGIPHHAREATSQGQGTHREATSHAREATSQGNSERVATSQGSHGRQEHHTSSVREATSPGSSSTAIREHHTSSRDAHVPPTTTHMPSTA